MKISELIEKLEYVNQDADVYIALSGNFPVKAEYLMYAEETEQDIDDDEPHLAFHDGNHGCSEEIAILIHEEE